MPDLSRLRKFPLRAGTKIPAVPKWQKVATSSEAAHSSWESFYDTLNFGIVADDLVILDVDNATHGGKDGLSVLASLVSEYTDDENWESPIEYFNTYTVRTASGGYHLYFHPRDGAKYVKGANKIGEGLDIQTGNAYVVAPGSTIPDSEFGVYTVVVNSEIKVLPEWLSELIRTKETELPSVSEVGRKPISDAWVRAVVKSQLNKLDECSSLGWGGPAWDETCFKVAASLIEIANNPHNGYPLELAYADYLKHAPTDLDFGPEKHEEKWASASRKVGNRQRTLDAKDKDRHGETPWQERIRRVSNREAPISSSALEMTLRLYADRVLELGWDEKPEPSKYFDRCIALLPSIKDSESAESWLSGSKQVIDKIGMKYGHEV